MAKVEGKGDLKNLVELCVQNTSVPKLSYCTLCQHYPERFRSDWGRECRKDKENGILKIGKWYMKSGVGLILVASSSTVILIAMKRGNSSKACSLVMRYSSEMFEAAALTSSAKSSGTSTR